MRVNVLVISVLVLLIGQLAGQGIPTWVYQRTPWAQSNANKRLGCRSVLSGAYSSIDCICSFLEDQINMHATPEYSLAQTFRVGWDYVLPQTSQNWGPLGAYTLSMRSDVYDNALAAIMLMNAGQMEAARRICDTLAMLVNLDPIGDGRTRSSYYHNNPIQRDYDGSTPLTYGAQVLNYDVLTGNMAWQILALGRWYHHSGDFKYLQAAIMIANFIQTNLKYDSPWGGYSAGYQYNTTTNTETKLNWRSVEHNIDVFAAARLLYGLTGDNQWKDMMSQAQKFVSAMYQSNGGYYYIGSPNGLNADSWVTSYPTCDGQTWNSLSEADDDVDKKTKSLNWVLSNLQVTEYQQDPLSGQTLQYNGVIFSTGGTGLQSEQTAAAAMAFYAHGQRIASTDPTNSKQFLDAAEKLLQTLLQMQKYAIRSDGHGIVASTNQGGAKVWPGDELAGETWTYLPLLHTAASAWTGLALQYIRNGDIYANPYADYSKKQVSKYVSTGVIYGQAVAPEPQPTQPLGQTYSIGIATLVISIAVGFVVLIALIILAAMNVRLYRRNKEIEAMDGGTAQELAAFTFKQLASPSSGTPTPVTPSSPVNE